MDRHTELMRLRWEIAGWSKQQAADLLGVSLNHYQKWESGRAPIPKYAIKLIKAYACGFLPEVPGWRCINGSLFTPNNDVITIGQVQAIPYYLAHIAALKMELRKHLNSGTAPATDTDV